MVSGQALVGENLASIRERIRVAATSADRDPASIVLVAVSKKKTADQIWEALQAGQRVFGENYVQEALKKKNEILARCASAGIEPPIFHLIGPIQKNKIKLTTGQFSVIESVGEMETAENLAAAATKQNQQQDIYLQVNISSEQSKSGYPPEDVVDAFGRCRELASLRVKGIMCIGQNPENIDLLQVRKREFALMREIRESLERTYRATGLELSMGMSDDFELAIANGATVIRVGTAIFGRR